MAPHCSVSKGSTVWALGWASFPDVLPKKVMSGWVRWDTAALTAYPEPVVYLSNLLFLLEDVNLPYNK